MARNPYRHDAEETLSLQLQDRTKRMLRLPFACALLALSTAAAHAQSYPAKPLRMIVPLPPGSTGDAIARMVADNLRQAYELSDVRYKAGYSPYLEVLDAQRELLQAQTLQILAARDVRFALIDLAKALGGGWEYETAVEPAATAAAKPQ